MQQTITRMPRRNILEFLAKFEELKASGKLNEKQLVFYEGQKAKYEKELKGFHH